MLKHFGYICANVSQCSLKAKYFRQAACSISYLVVPYCLHCCDSPVSTELTYHILCLYRKFPTQTCTLFPLISKFVV